MGELTHRVCKDCRSECAPFDPPKRLAAYPGPRCYTHHQTETKRAKKAKHERGVQRVYGLKPGEYDRLYEFQGGKCAWCQLAMGKSTKLPVDHDHATGAPRGLLCHACNQFLGWRMRDDPEAIARGIAYLAAPPYGRMLALELLATQLEETP